MRRINALTLILILFAVPLLGGAVVTRPGQTSAPPLAAEKDHSRRTDERKVRISPTGYVALPAGFTAYHIRTWVDVWYDYIVSPGGDFRIDISGGLVQSPFEAGEGKLLWSRVEQTPTGRVRVGLSRTDSGEVAVASAPWVNFRAHVKGEGETNTFLRIVRSYRQEKCDDCTSPLPAPAQPSEPAEDTREIMRKALAGEPTGDGLA